jgi:hypothetical protein
VIVGAVLVAATALLLTALTQRRGWRLEQMLRARDVFSVLPLWTFFAPNPGTTDTRLLWREAFSTGATSHWHELSPPRRGGAWQAVWNPNRRIQKAIADAGALLAESRSREELDVVMLSVPYLMLLTYVAAQVGSAHGIARQFLLVQTSGDEPAFDEVTILVTSRWHAVSQPLVAARRAA